MSLAKRSFYTKSKADGRYVNENSAAADIPDLTFQPLTLRNNRQGYCFGEGDPGIARSVEGVVHFHGGMCRASGSSLNPFVVPAEFVPTHDQYIPVDLCNGHTGSIFISSVSGEVFITDDPTSESEQAPCFTSLAGVFYPPPY